VTYFHKLDQIARQNQSLLCVGLDTDPAKLPAYFRDKPNGQLLFNRAIVEATAPYVCCYKINMAFYEAHRHAGLTAVIETLMAIPPEIPVICDSKRADIGNTSDQYAQAIFETLKFDATTVPPYMGYDSLAPFFRHEDKGTYILCLTSNAGAADFQMVNDLYLRVAEKAQQWNVAGNIGLVVGATHPSQAVAVREAAPDLPFLIPGVGAQGGSVAEAAAAAAMKSGRGLVMNASRSVLYASNGEDYAQAAAAEANRMRQEINAALQAM